MEQKEKIKGDKGAMITGGDDFTMVDMVTKKRRTKTVQSE